MWWIGWGAVMVAIMLSDVVAWWIALILLGCALTDFLGRLRGPL